MKYPWLAHFNINESELLTAFNSQIPKPNSLISYALSSGIIIFEIYIRWAKNYYNIPVLNEDFFSSKNAPNEQFWLKWKSFYPWNSTCMPVAEWENQVIVGCLEPLSPLPANLSAIFVLTQPTQLENLWKKFHTNENIQQKPSIPTALPSQSSVTEFKELQLLDESETSEAPEGMGEISKPDEIEIPQGMEGLNLDLKSLKNKSEDFSLQLTDDKNKSNDSESDEYEMPDGFDLKTTEQKASIKQEKQEPEKVEASEEIGENTKHNVEMSAPQPPKTTQTPTPVIKNSAVQQPSTFSNVSFLEKLYTNSKPEFSKITNITLNKLKTHFNKSIIFTISPNEDSTKPLVWSSNFANVQKSNPIPLKEPSIFRIVSTTQKPYHGFVVSNKTNDEFFSFWNSGETPENMTIVPIIINNQITGMIVNFSDRISFNKATLKFAEEVSQDFSNMISRSAFSKAA